MAETTKNMTFDVNLLPATTGDHNLGSSALKWGNLYSTTAQFSILSAPTSSDGITATGKLYLKNNEYLDPETNSDGTSLFFGSKATSIDYGYLTQDFDKGASITYVPPIKANNDSLVREPSLFFENYSYNGTSGSILSTKEFYYFPTVEEDLTENPYYMILTTKEPVKIGQGGTGVTAIADIKAGKDGDGNTISSTYLKLSGGTVNGRITTTNGFLTEDNYFVKMNNGATGGLHFIDSATNTRASIWSSVSTTAVSPEIWFRIYSYNTNGSRLNTYEDFHLPTVGHNLQTSATYNILTTKNFDNPVRLFTGPATINSTNTLSSSYQNYKMLKITFITNSDYKVMWLDTKSIALNKYYIDCVAGATAWGAVSSFYISQCGISFISTTSFTTNSLYNNGNYNLKVYTIDGYF